jgi:AcrR family transcriptional regulator
MSDPETPQIRKPVQTRSRETRRKILDTAKGLFTQKGYARTNSKEIARLAGVATGSFYAYFPDKGAVFLEITEEYYREIFSSVQKAAESISANLKSEPSSRQNLIVKQLVYALYEAHNIEPELHREISLMILAGGQKVDPDDPDSGLFRSVRERVDQLDNEVQSWLKGLISVLKPGNDADVAAGLVFRVTEETIHRLRQFPETLPAPDAVLGELVTMLCAYLFSAE